MCAVLFAIIYNQSTKILANCILVEAAVYYTFMEHSYINDH